MSAFDWDDDHTHLIIAMDEQIASLEASIKHNSLHMDPFTPKRIVAIWKMLKGDELPPEPSWAEQFAEWKAANS